MCLMFKLHLLSWHRFFLKIRLLKMLVTGSLENIDSNFCHSKLNSESQELSKLTFLFLNSHNSTKVLFIPGGQLRESCAAELEQNRNANSEFASLRDLQFCLKSSKMTQFYQMKNTVCPLHRWLETHFKFVFINELLIFSSLLVTFGNP